MRRTTFSIQWKVIAVVLVTAGAMLGAMIWKTEFLLDQDKTAFLMDSAVKQIAPLKRLVKQRLGEEKDVLLHFAGVRAGQSGSSRNASFGNFDVVSLIQPADGGSWTPSWIEKNPNAKDERWPKGYDMTLLKSLAYSRVRDGETVWTRVSDRQGDPVYAFMISVEIQQPLSAREEAAVASSSSKTPVNAQSTLPDTAEQVLASMNMSHRAVLVGFSTMNPLAEVTEDYIGSTNAVYLVDDRGYVAAHSNKAYQGALFTEDPLVREILKTRKTGSTGKFEDLESRPVLGHYERIEHSNLYAVITTPQEMLNSIVSTQKHSALITGLGALFLCLGAGAFAGWLIGRQATAQVRKEESEAAATLTAYEELTKSLIAQKPVEKFTEKTGSDLVQEVPEKGRARLQTDPILSEGLVRALTEPLHGILGHASLIRAKAGDEEIQDHAESITREARRMREVVERIHEWEDEAVFDADVKPESFNLNEVIEAALGSAADDFASQDINVQKTLRPLPDLRGSRTRVSAAMSRIIENAVEAMHARNPRVLRVETDFDSENIILRFIDTGVGMSRDVCDRALEPFFKGFESPKRLGLGLASVSSTVKAFGGKIEIDSIPGEGATLSLRFPVPEIEIQTYRERESRELALAVASRFVERELPQPELMAEATSEELEMAAMPDIHDDHLMNIELPKASASAPAPIAKVAAKPAAPVIEQKEFNFDDEFRAEVIQPKIFASLISEEFIDDEDLVVAPAPEKPARKTSGPLMLDENDDDDEMFANIPLSKAASRLTKVGQIQEKADPVVEAAPAKKPKAEVKIRKPRINDSQV